MRNHVSHGSWRVKSRMLCRQTTRFRLSAEAGLCGQRPGEKRQSVLVPYKGAALKEMTVYQVQVSVWDNYGELGQVTGNFETGLMREENWNAKWITHTLPAEETACPVFVRSFSLDRPVKRARLYATACGVYEAFINGRKTGDLFLAPAGHLIITDCSIRLMILRNSWKKIMRLRLL